jgi:hypothetical protein
LQVRPFAILNPLAGQQRRHGMLTPTSPGHLMNNSPPVGEDFNNTPAKVRKNPIGPKPIHAYFTSLYPFTAVS